MPELDVSPLKACHLRYSALPCISVTNVVQIAQECVPDAHLLQMARSRDGSVLEAARGCRATWRAQHDSCSDCCALSTHA
jgi:hypothetical protein